MRCWTKDKLLKEGYNIYNGVVTSAKLELEDHDILTFWMFLDTEEGDVAWGGRDFGSLDKIKRGVHISKEDNCLAEYLLNIMKIVGVRNLNDLKGTNVRIAYREKSYSISSVLGNIFKDEWFDPEDFVNEFYSKKPKSSSEEMWNVPKESLPEDVKSVFKHEDFSDYKLKPKQTIDKEMLKSKIKNDERTKLLPKIYMDILYEVIDELDVFTIEPTDIC